MIGGNGSTTVGGTGPGWSVLEPALRRAVDREAVRVHVIGRPGGLVRLHSGVVVDAWTVGTPLGVPSPTRRAPDDSAPGRPTRLAALADMLFTIASGSVQGVWEESEPPIRAGGADLERLLRETRRRLAVLHAGGQPLYADTPLTAAPPDRRGARLLSRLERAVLGLVGNGTITPRDVAFLLDRGLYAVTLDLAHLVEAGLVEVVRRPAPAAAPVAEPVIAAPVAPAPPARPRDPEAPLTPVGPPPVAERAPGGVLGLFARRRRPPVAAPGAPAETGPPPQLTRRVPGGSGMPRPEDRPS